MLVGLTLVVPNIITVLAGPVHQYTISDNSHWQKLANFTVTDSEIDVSKYVSSMTGEGWVGSAGWLLHFSRSDHRCCQGGDSRRKWLLLSANTSQGQ